MARTVKTIDSSRPGREPLRKAYADMAAQSASSFRAVEQRYLRAMYEFDQLVIRGIADQGDIQNGKGDFLNDVLALLLENCSGKHLHTRPDVPGLSFRRNKLDIAYPSEGPVLLTIETKATGIPKHARNPRQPQLGFCLFAGALAQASTRMSGLAL